MPISTDDIIPLIYVFGYLAFWKTCCWWFIKELGPRIDGTDVAISIFAGTVMTLFWPFILIAVIAKKLLHHRGQTIVEFVKPRHERRRSSLQERERRIRDLERELGIGEIPEEIDYSARRQKILDNMAKWRYRYNRR